MNTNTTSPTPLLAAFSAMEARIANRWDSSCEREELHALIVSAVNSHAELVKALRAMVDAPDADSRHNAAQDALALLAKVGG